MNGFDSLFGKSRGSKRQLSYAPVVRTQIKSFGMKSDDALHSSVGDTEVFAAAKQTCSECKHEGMSCEHYVASSMRNTIKSITGFALVLGLVAPGMGLASFSVIFWVFAIVFWQVFKDAGRRSLAVCPSCNHGQRMGWGSTPKSNSSGQVKV